MGNFEFAFTYVEIGDVLDVHAEAMQITGDPPQGVYPDRVDLLKAALEHIQNDNFYRSIDAKLTHLLFSVCQLHVFFEGNKRTTVAVGAKFLANNGFEHRVAKFIRYMENVVVCLADNKISKGFLGEIVIAFLNEEEEEEELKLRILEALEEVRRDQEQRDAANQPN